MKKFLSLKQLHYLVTLSETQHFGDAAKQCFVSQSTLSSGIQNLETVLGCQLLERDNKTFFFTEMGHKVAQQARTLLASSQDLMGLTESGHQPMEGVLRVGCIPTIAPFVLGDLVRSVNDRYPKLQLFLREQPTSQLLKALKHGDLDCVILALPSDIEGFDSQIIGFDPFKLVLSQTLANRLPCDFSYHHLPERTLFFLEKEHCLTDHALTACQMAIQAKIHPFPSSSLHTLVAMIANGVGGTFVPQIAIDSGLLEGHSVSVLSPPFGASARKIALVWRRTSHRETCFQRLGALLSPLFPHSAAFQ